MTHTKWPPTTPRRSRIRSCALAKRPLSKEDGLQNKAKTPIYLMVVGLFLLSGYVATTWRANGLDFVRSSSPLGYRELLLQGGGLPTSQLLTVGLNNSGGAGSVTEKIDPQKLCTLLFDDPSSPRVGSDDSAIRMVTFFDYRCSYCRTLTKIISDLQSSGKFQVIYKEWPILGESSELAARAALAADKQGQYIALHKRLMDSRLIPTPQYIEALAKDLKLNVPQLLGDMGREEISASIQRSTALAAEFRFAGTPALVVGRTIVRGAITRAQLEQLIELEAVSDLKSAC